MYWMLLPFRRYVDFRGRSRRREYWLFSLLHTCILVALLTTIVIADGRDDDETTVLAAITLLLYFLGSIVPQLAVQVRRLHDSDRTGWWLLLGLVPVGGLVLIVFMCLDGTAGPNRFGPDPKERRGDFSGTAPGGVAA